MITAIVTTNIKKNYNFDSDDDDNIHEKKYNNINNQKKM